MFLNKTTKMHATASTTKMHATASTHLQHVAAMQPQVLQACECANAVWHHRNARGCAQHPQLLQLHQGRQVLRQGAQEGTALRVLWMCAHNGWLEGWRRGRNQEVLVASKRGRNKQPFACHAAHQLWKCSFVRCWQAATPAGSCCSTAHSETVSSSSAVALLQSISTAASPRSTSRCTLHRLRASHGAAAGFCRLCPSIATGLGSGACVCLCQKRKQRVAAWSGWRA